MISAGDFYSVMCAMVPLYFAMLVAYGSVRCWKIFTLDQCSGINRFVAVFAVPVLSFHFIAQNDPYKMDLRFIVADTLSKIFVLVILCFWSVVVSSRSGLDWVITLFSVSTLPNTLVMGIPLLKAMYGGFTQSLMVQLVVLQCIIWYTMLLFLFEYRAATVIIRDNFPGELAASITNIEVDGDVVSLHGQNPLVAESVDTDNNGRVRVRIRRSSSGHNSTAQSIVTSRPSNLSGAEIYSVNTRASSDAYSLQPTPRESNFDERDVSDTPVWLKSSPASTNSGLKVFRPQYSPSNVVVVWEEEEKCEALQGKKAIGDGKDLSFRSTSKFMEDDDDEMEDEKNKQKMPGTVVMLRLILTMVGRKLSRNPNTYSSLLGLLWSLISYKWDIRMPILIKNSIKIISDAGLGMAMFSLGLFMALQPRIIACGPKMATISMAIRFICGPIVMSAASIAVGLRGARLHTAIVQAALPQGIVPFVFAREYGLHPDILSTGVIFGMLVSLPVTLLYYIFLGL